MIDRPTVRKIREGERGLALCLYLDLDEPEVEEWFNVEMWQVAAFSRAASEAIVCFLNGIKEGESVITNDEAGRAVALLMNVGEDRQAWLAPILESVSETRTLAACDPLAGFAPDIEPDQREARGLPGSDGGRDDATAAIAEAERLLERDGE